MNNLQRGVQERMLVHNIVKYKDRDAFGHLYDVYVSKIYRFVFFKVNNVEEAQDITSMVFLKAWSYLTEEKEKRAVVKSISGLLYSVARNMVVDHYREKGKKQQYLTPHVSENLVSDTNLQETLETKQDAQTLIDLLQKLKQEYQEVITMRYIDELTLKEIAQVLGKSMVNVRVLLHRATKKLEELHESVSQKNEEKS